VGRLIVWRNKMVESREFEGKTVDEAIEKACKELNLKREQLQIDVITSGSSGIFGIVGARKAKIRVSPKEMLPDDQVKLAKEVLENILNPFDVPVVVEGKIKEDQIYLDIISNGSGLFIGRRGQTLDALQYIVNKIVKKEISQCLSIVVDSENYRERRKKSLIDLAKQLGRKARKSSRPVASSPMNAHDRRIIHLTLKKEKGVRTKSKGEGAFRKVVVFPVKRGNSSRNAGHGTNSRKDPPQAERDD